MARCLLPGRGSRSGRQGLRPTFCWACGRATARRWPGWPPAWCCTIWRRGCQRLPPSAYPSAGRESFWASMEPLAINSSVAQSFCAAYSGDPHLGPRRQPTFFWTFSAFAPEVSPVERVCILKEAPVPRARRCLRVACTPPGHCVAACTRLRPCTTLSASPYKTRSRSSAGSSALLRGAWSSSREAWRPS